MLNQIRIPREINRKALIDSVDRLVVAQQRIDAATNTVYSIIRASGGEPDSSRKLDHWYELNHAEFIKELERRKIRVSIKQRAEWIEMLDEKKALIAHDILDVVKINDVIDALVFDAYALTPAERAKSQ